MRNLQWTVNRKGVYFLAILASFTLLCNYSLVAQDPVKADSSFALAQDRYKHGMELLKKGEKSEALSQFSDAADLFGDYQDYLYAKLDSIKSIMESLLAKEPESAVYNYLMGRWYSSAQRDTGGEQRARSFLEKAVRLEPKLGWTYISLARLNSRKGNNEEAVKQYRRAIEVNPDFSPAFNYLAGTLDRMGKEDEALKLRNQMLQRDSTSFSATMVMLELARKAKTSSDKELLYRKAARLSVSSELREDAYRELLWALLAEKPDSARSLAHWLLTVYRTSDKYTHETAQMIIFQAMQKSDRNGIPAYAKQLLGEKDPVLLGQIGSFCVDSLHNLQTGLQCLEAAFKVCTG